MTEKSVKILKNEFDMKKSSKKEIFDFHKFEFPNISIYTFKNLLATMSSEEAVSVGV